MGRPRESAILNAIDQIIRHIITFTYSGFKNWEYTRAGIERAMTQIDEIQKGMTHMESENQK